MKPREFWIDETMIIGKPCANYAFKHREDAEEKALGKTIHAIEYQAFKDLETELMKAHLAAHEIFTSASHGRKELTEQRASDLKKQIGLALKKIRGAE